MWLSKLGKAFAIRTTSDSYSGDTRNSQMTSCRPLWQRVLRKLLPRIVRVEAVHVDRKGVEGRGGDA